MQIRNGQAANATGHANMPGGYMPGAGGMMPGMPGMLRMSAGLAGGMPGAPLIGGYMAVLEADGWETVGVGRKTKRETTGMLPVQMTMPGMGTAAPTSSALIGSGTAQLNLLPRQSGYVGEYQGVLDTAKEAVRSSPPPAQLQPAELPATDLSKKTLSLVEEYFSVVDHNEALLRVQEVKAPDFHPELVGIVLSLALDQRDRECALVCKLLVHLNARGRGIKARYERGCAADCRAAGGYCYGCPWGSKAIWRDGCRFNLGRSL
ncbi:unnamed protein product [Sphagnum troendelagicum]|uniref:MI domain-containing protein n=1 Tax=Sphagnum troendelagicum TaxID=128251 RepID=A0ABP0TKL0_9BRYO